MKRKNRENLTPLLPSAALAAKRRTLDNSPSRETWKNLESWFFIGR